MGAVFLITIGILVAYVVLRKLGVRTSPHRHRRVRRRERNLYQELLRKALGDPDLVERLIALESKKHPQAGREQWMQHALDAWKRHNH